MSGDVGKLSVVGVRTEMEVEAFGYHDSVKIQIGMESVFRDRV